MGESGSLGAAGIVHSSPRNLSLRASFIIDTSLGGLSSHELPVNVRLQGSETVGLIFSSVGNCSRAPSPAWLSLFVLTRWMAGPRESGAPLTS